MWGAPPTAQSPAGFSCPFGSAPGSGAGCRPGGGSSSAVYLARLCVMRARTSWGEEDGCQCQAPGRPSHLEAPRAGFSAPLVLLHVGALDNRKGETRVPVGDGACVPVGSGRCPCDGGLRSQWVCVLHLGRQEMVLISVPIGHAWAVLRGICIRVERVRVAMGPCPDVVPCVTGPQKYSTSVKPLSSVARETSTHQQPLLPCFADCAMPAAFLSASACLAMIRRRSLRSGVLRQWR